MVSIVDREVLSYAYRTLWRWRDFFWNGKSCYRIHDQSQHSQNVRSFNFWNFILFILFWCVSCSPSVQSEGFDVSQESWELLREYYSIISCDLSDNVVTSCSTSSALSYLRELVTTEGAFLEMSILVRSILVDHLYGAFSGIWVRHLSARCNFYPPWIQVG